MKENRKRWTPLLTCGLLCVLLLSSCSGVMQSLADRTNAVLGGLAEGTDRVTGALADLTDNAMEAAAGATDDSVKDDILDAYCSILFEIYSETSINQVGCPVNASLHLLARLSLS